jgi:uncharacterized protein YbcC (UPF0753/DUF2309 family)
MPKTLSMKTITTASDTAARAIPPVWPLASSVAVNPYLGQTGETLAETGARLGRVAGVPVTMPREVYRARIADGTITDQDILDAIAASADAQSLDLNASRRWRGGGGSRPQAPAHHRAARRRGLRHRLARHHRGPVRPLGRGLFRPGSGALGRPARRGAYDAWRQYATHDLTPEIAGLKGFAQFVSETPDTADEAQKQAMTTLGLPEAALGRICTSSCSGWAAGRRWAAITCGRRSLRAARMRR